MAQKELSPIFPTPQPGHEKDRLASSENLLVAETKEKLHIEESKGPVMLNSSIIADSAKAVKLNGDNYDMWSRRAMYYMFDIDLSDHLRMVMIKPVVPESGATAAQRRDLEAYQKWEAADMKARYNLLCLMEDNLIREFKTAASAKEMWELIKEKYGSTSVTKLRVLGMRFYSYHKKPEHSMIQHLRAMSLMIRELHAAGHILSDEQQVQAVLRSLPRSWDSMKQNMTHNMDVKTFEDIKRHLLLEYERLEIAKITPASRPRGNGKKAYKDAKGKGKAVGGPKPKISKRKRGKRTRKPRDMTKVLCYNCQKIGHLTRDCTKLETQERATT